MHFRNNIANNWLILLLMIASFNSGLIFNDMIDLPEKIVINIIVTIYIVAYLIHKLIIRFSPLRRIEKKIKKQPCKHHQLKLFFEEYIPETKKRYPKKIYKYISLFDFKDCEYNVYNSLSSQLEYENYLLNVQEPTDNENRLFSLATNSLWFSRCSNSKLNDPFEGRRIVYDRNYLPLNEGEINYWKEYAEEIRDNLFLCCFSKNPDSPPMWANYANNYRGYCLEFEIISPDCLWEVYYGYGKNTPNIEFDGLQRDLWEGRINRDEAYKYIKQLHIYWASSKYRDWEFENEIRALLVDLDKDMNVKYETIGIKLSAIIVGHNCIREHREFLQYIADKLSIPLKTTVLNTTGITSIDISDYE